MPLKKSRFALETAARILRALQPVVEGNLALKAVVSGALIFIERCQAIEDLKQDYQDFAILVMEYALVLNRIIEPEQRETQESLRRESEDAKIVTISRYGQRPPKAVITAMQRLNEIIESLNRFLLVTEMDTQRRCVCVFLRRLVLYDEDRQYLKQLKEEFRNVLEMLQLETQLGISKDVRALQIDFARRDEKQHHLLHRILRYVKPSPKDPSETKDGPSGSVARRFLGDVNSQRLEDVGEKPKRQADRDAERPEMHDVKAASEGVQHAAPMNAAELQYLKSGLVELYNLLRNTDLKVDNMHQTQQERDTILEAIRQGLANIAHCNCDGNVAAERQEDMERRRTADIEALSSAQRQFTDSVSGAIRKLERKRQTDREIDQREMAAYQKLQRESTHIATQANAAELQDLKSALAELSRLLRSTDVKVNSMHRTYEDSERRRATDVRTLHAAQQESTDILSAAIGELERKRQVERDIERQELNTLKAAYHQLHDEAVPAAARMNAAELQYLRSAIEELARLLRDTDKRVNNVHRTQEEREKSLESIGNELATVNQRIRGFNNIQIGQQRQDSENRHIRIRENATRRPPRRSISRPFSPPPLVPSHPVVSTLGPMQPDVLPVLFAPPPVHYRREREVASEPRAPPPPVLEQPASSVPIPISHGHAAPPWPQTQLQRPTNSVPNNVPRQNNRYPWYTPLPRVWALAPVSG